MIGESIHGASGTHSTWSAMPAMRSSPSVATAMTMSVARLCLLDLRDHFFVPGVLGSNAQHGHFLVDQRDGTVFHFACGIAFGVNVGNLLEFERAFVGDGHVDAASQIQTAREYLSVRGLLFRLSGSVSSTRPARSGIEAQVGDQCLACFVVNRAAQVCKQNRQHVLVHQRRGKGFRGSHPNFGSGLHRDKSIRNAHGL